MSQFAKRHYEAIALVMQEAQMHVRSDAIEQNSCLVNLLADMLQRDNWQFKRDRFIAAGELGANVKLRTRYKVVQREP